jgi:GrpB-like predicted nucleotidyltransferase (UPF0157 family)
MPELDEPVHLVEHRLEWAADFAFERSRLADALSIEPACIQHIGSTSVPDLVAKPVIDIMVGLPSYPPSDATNRQLTRLGYEPFGEAGVRGRSYFRLRDGSRSVNVHIVGIGGGHWVRNLALRDYLRNSPLARDKYGRAKRAAQASGTTLLAYSEAKARVVIELLGEAGIDQNDG